MPETAVCQSRFCGQGPCRVPAGFIVADRSEVPPGCPNLLDAAVGTNRIRGLLHSPDVFVTHDARSAVAHPAGRPERSIVAGVEHGSLVVLLPRVKHSFRGATVKMRETPATPPELRGPPDQPTQTSWIKLRVVDDSSGEPLSGVNLRVTLPNRRVQEYLTQRDGMVEIHDIDAGTFDVTSSIADARLEDTLDFVVIGNSPSGVSGGDGDANAGASSPAPTDGAGNGADSQSTEASRPPASGTRIAEIDQHRVQTGETLESVAAAAGMTLQDLALFNWDTSDPDEINKHLRDDVGCTRRTADGTSFVFDATDDPGIVFVPRAWSEAGLATDQEHKFRVRSFAHTPAMIECVCIPGITFEFDKSFIRPSVVDKMKEMDAELTQHPHAKLIIWGHTDRVGNEQYNKDLSDRRAKSTFAFITNDADIWEELYNQEHWGLSTTQTILTDLAGDDPSFDPGRTDGINDGPTQQAVKNYQSARGLAADGFAGPNTRKRLYTDYMTGKHDVHVSESQFAEPKFMGCGEFNPFLAPNAAELANKAPGNEPNRRVVLYLFNRPPKNVPCRLHDTGPCKTQLVQLGGRADRTPNPPFPCAFYDGIARNCHCEGVVLPVPPLSAMSAAWDRQTAQEGEKAKMILTAPGLKSGTPVTFEVFQEVGEKRDSVGNVQVTSRSDGADAPWDDWFHPATITDRVDLNEGEDFPDVRFSFTAKVGSAGDVTSDNTVLYEDKIDVELSYESQTKLDEREFVLYSPWGSRVGKSDSGGKVVSGKLPPGGVALVLGNGTWLGS